MTKYIVKNCPSLNQARNLCNEIISTCYADYNMGREVVLCKDCTDCILKQIVEKCRFWLKYSVDKHCAKEILDMLETEELQDET